MKSKIIEKVIAVKRRINITPELREFIFTNINYRRKVYNDFVEESRKYEKLKDFDPIKYKVTYFNEVEKPNNVYDEICVGISEQVAKDIKNAKLSMRGNKTLYRAKLQFKKFDPFYGAFKVHCKGAYRKGDIFHSRVHLLDDDLISFRVRDTLKIFIQLHESLFNDATFRNHNYPYYIDEKNQYMFRNDCVKEIAFVHELGKFYIVLFMEVYYYRSKDEIPKEKCGIDLGIKNPVTLYDGNDVKTFRMSKRQLKRIAYLERRAKRLQQIMDRKLRVNNYYHDTGISKNYRKVQRKFRLTHKKIYNIRLEWRRKLALHIARNYHKVCIDTFEAPTIDSLRKKGIPKKAIHRINYMARLYGVYDLYTLILHDVSKYNGKIYDSPKNSTRTCSVCGHLNDKLPLSKRILHCTKCGSEIDRDANAAMNCYDFIS